MERDWIDYIALFFDGVVAATAVVTAIVAYREYIRIPKEEGDDLGPNVESFEGPGDKALTIFKTSNQETKLVASTSGLVCELEDKRPNRGGTQWVLSPNEVEEILERSLYSVHPGPKARVGTVNIGPRRGWLYSKRLHPDPDYLLNELRSLLRSVRTI